VVQLVGFTIEIYHDARPHKRQTAYSLALHCICYCYVPSDTD